MTKEFAESVEVEASKLSRIFSTLDMNRDYTLSSDRTPAKSALDLLLMLKRRKGE